jgi:hypothetical protein
MMSAAAVKRVKAAMRIMDVYVRGYDPCWVCANRGHGHRIGGCPSDQCPCGRRRLEPVWPEWRP